jgi:hypothetical protein
MLYLFHDRAIFIDIIDSVLQMCIVLPEYENLPLPSRVPVAHHLLNSFALDLPIKHATMKLIEQL